MTWNASQGVYLIVNTANGKKYVGSSLNLRKRFARHRNELSHGEHHSQKLQRAWNKYGASCFQFSVLEYIADRDSVRDREQYYLDLLCPEYNMALHAEPIKNAQANAKRKPMSAERKQEISDFFRGRKMPREAVEKSAAKRRGRVVSDETRLKISESVKKHYSEHPETIARISDALRGRQVSADVVKKIINSRKDYRHSEETKAKMRQSALVRGQKPSNDAIQKAVTSRLAKGISEETRGKMSASQKACRSSNSPQMVSEETRAKISASLRKYHEGKKQ